MTREPGLYWVKWAADQDWDIGSFSGRMAHSWWAIGTEEWQDEPEVIGQQLNEPDAPILPTAPAVEGLREKIAQIIRGTVQPVIGHGALGITNASAHRAAEQILALLPAQHQPDREVEGLKAELADKLSRIRAFAQDSMENCHDRATLGNLYAIRDTVDAITSELGEG